MAIEQYKPYINSLGPGKAFWTVKVDELAAAGGDSTVTFDRPFAKVPEIISTTAISDDAVIAVSVKTVTETQITLSYAPVGAAGSNDVEIKAIVQGQVS